MLSEDVRVDTCEAANEISVHIQKIDEDVSQCTLLQGSGAKNPAAFAAAIGAARRVCDAGVTLGFDMTTVDLGGGFVPCADAGAPLPHQCPKILLTRAIPLKADSPNNSKDVWVTRKLESVCVQQRRVGHAQARVCLCMGKTILQA